MPEQYRSLVVVLILSLTVFAVLRPTVRAPMGELAYDTMRRLWVGLTIIGFLSGSFWVFATVGAAWIVISSRNFGGRAALFPCLLLCMPPLAMEIPGFGMMNYLFSLSVPRLLAIILLLPAAIKLLRRRMRPTSIWPDRLFTLFILVQIALTSRNESATAMLRETFLVLIDVVLPYFVLSRSVRSPLELKQAIGALLIGSIILSVLATFEAGKNWLVYSSLTSAWGIEDQIGDYLHREGMLRARASTNDPIALGYVAMIGVAMFMSLRGELRSRVGAALCVIALACGLLAPLSRGPWVGVAACLLCFAVTAKRPANALAVLSAAALLATALMNVLPGGARAMAYLPFVGTIDTYNVDYRKRLIDNTIFLVEQNPLFGSPDFVRRLTALGMVQGQGIVDVVNTYAQIALSSGLVGLFLFGAFFLSIVFALLRTGFRARTHGRSTDGMVPIGRALLACIGAILVTIGTVSSVSVIPWLYWSIAGLSVAWLRIASESPISKIPETEWSGSSGRTAISG